MDKLIVALDRAEISLHDLADRGARLEFSQALLKHPVNLLLHIDLKAREHVR